MIIITIVTNVLAENAFKNKKKYLDVVEKISVLKRIQLLIQYTFKYLYVSLLDIVHMYYLWNVSHWTVYNDYIEDSCLVHCKIGIYFTEWAPKGICAPLVKINELLVFARWNIFRSYTKLNKFSSFFSHPKKRLKRHFNLVLNEKHAK
jgi:hypothetical protein